MPTDSGADRSGGTRLQLPNVQRTLLSGGIGWAFVADATLTYLGVPSTIPGGVYAICDDGGIALDIPAKYYVVYVRASAPTVLRACRQEQWASVYGGADAISIAYVTDHYDIPMPISYQCIPFVNNLDPTVSVYAGVLDTTGALGDGGLATSGHLSNPGALAVGPDGSLFIYEQGGSGAIRRVDRATGIITTLSLTGFSANGNDGNPFILFYGQGDGGLLVDGGRLYISSRGTGKIISVKLDGTDQRDEVAGLPTPNGMCRGPGNTILFSCASDGTVKSWDRTANTVTTILGDGTTWATKGFGVGNQYDSSAGVGAASATSSGVYLTFPADIVIGPDGVTYISTGQHTIRSLVGSGAPGQVFVRNTHFDYLEDSDTGGPVAVGYTDDCVGTAYGARSGKAGLLMDPTGHLWFSSCGTLWRTRWFVTSPGSSTYEAMAGTARGGLLNPPCLLSQWSMNGGNEEITGFAIAPDGTYYLSSPARHVVYRLGCPTA